MTTARRACLWVLCLLAVPASAAFAQAAPAEPANPPPAHLSLIEGQAFIDRDGRSDAAVANVPLLEGDRVRTVEGRVEVILADGSLLHVDRDTAVDVLAPDLLRLLQGRVYVVVRGARNPSAATRYQIDTPAASVQTLGPGEFRIVSTSESQGTEVELAVVRGQATIANDLGAQEVRAGERAVVREGLAPSYPQYFNSARWDAFDRWSAARREDQLSTVSGQYLPAELSVYASTFDRYGTWRHDEVEGAVWYPSVAVDWRPYSVGYWRTYPSWGSVWIGGDAWGWPTHHYGYWGFSVGFGWYWRPAPVWGPAWVYWAYSPGYVSWCPLGRGGFPVFGHFGVRGGFYGGRVDPWRGWTVVPRQHFGTGMPVHRVAVDGNRLDPSARGAFEARPSGPGTSRAVPRSYAGGGMAVPRGSAGPASPRNAYAAPAAPRNGGGTGLADRGMRPSPSEAARTLAGGARGSMEAVPRRTLPDPPALGGASRRTEMPRATPDVTAFGSRRDSIVAPQAVPGAAASGMFDSRARARSYPRAAPASPQAGSTGWSEPPAARQGYPRAYDGQSPANSRDPSSMRGTGRTVPEGYTRQRTPDREATPRSYSAPPSAPPARSRDGGGMVSGPATRSGGGGGSSSAPSAAPRYNPGSGASQPRGGGSSPPQRRRGGNPD
jgi:hypothetical protein